jgi:GNAT superfamily N-acetyltransferase
MSSRGRTHSLTAFVLSANDQKPWELLTAFLMRKEANSMVYIQSKQGTTIERDPSIASRYLQGAYDPMNEEFVLREVDIHRDAVKLAAMWRESDGQWPGTWSRGVEITPEMITEWHERERMINCYIFETRDEAKIVAYCGFNQLPEAKDEGYVDLLNVAPSYQGKSLGRRLLQRCLERCSELGFRLLTLGTWSGNLKSVPLYKKTGFFWVPDTSVWMLNFVPSILNLPCARPYFARHDWYRTFKRTLKQAEDDERWHDMKVFTYRWEEDGEALTVWADREAHALTAIETDAFFAGAIAGNIEPAKGMSTVLRWQLTNKGQSPLAVSLIATGTEHIRLDHRAMLALAPGETREIEAQVELAPDTPDVKRDKPVPTIRSLLIIDGEVLELGTGLRPRPAVAISTAPNHVTLFPGVPKTVHVQLRSHLPEQVEATISLAPAPGLSTDWTQNQVQIPAKSYAALPVTLTAGQGGVYPLYATAYFQGPNGAPSDNAPLGSAPQATHKTLPERLAVFSMPPGGVLADTATGTTGEDESHGAETRIENEWTRLILRQRGGEMRFLASQSGVGLGSFQERVGPPFWPSELEDREYEVVLQEENGRITAEMTADMEAYPEMAVRRRVTLGGGPLIEIEHALANKSPQTHELQIDRNAHIWHREGATFTVPLKGGIVQSRATEFPAAEEDIPKKPESLQERWVATTSKWGTLGLIWKDTVVENEFSWGLHLLTPKLACCPQTWTPAGKLYVYAGPGDWRTVRGYARRLASMDGEPEPIPPREREVYDVRLEPVPLVTVDDRVQATLVVDNLRSRSLEGKAELILPAPLRADPASFTVTGVTANAPLSESVAIALPPEPAAYVGRIALESRLFDRRIPVPVIRLGTRQPEGEVRVSETTTDGRPIYEIDNGRTRFSVAPAFSGAITRWEEAGINHLLSPFPEVKTFGWMSPWYGGITPVVMKESGWDIPGKLDQETLSATVVEQADERDIPWRGVRISAEIKREQLVGLSVEFDYLTVGGSNVLKLVCRIRNRTTAKRRLSVGWLTYWQLDGASTGNTLRSQDIERKHTPWESWPDADHWGTLTNPQTGRTATLVSPYPDVKLIDWGDAGGHLGYLAGIDVMPASTSSAASTERTCYIALCDSWNQARISAWLSKYL